METAIKIVGMIGYLILCIGGAAFALSLAFACCEKAFEKLITAIRESERFRLEHQMYSDSWWFSEDERTMLLLQSYSSMRLSGSRSVDEVRSKWRNYTPGNKD